MPSEIEMTSVAPANPSAPMKKNLPKKSALDMFPIPDGFYAIKAEVKLISSQILAIVCGCFLYVAAFGTFVALLLFYMAPAQWETKSLTQSSWDGGTLTCRPLQKMDLHGISTMWNYDECMENVQEVNGTTVYGTTTDGATHFDYKWTEEKSGVVSYFAASRKDPVTNPTSELEGHTCVVSSPDDKYGLRMSYDGCIGAVEAPSATTVGEYSTSQQMGYHYNWTISATEDYKTWDLGSPVENAKYELAGYACKNTKVDSRYGLLFESDAACNAAVIPPNTESVSFRENSPCDCNTCESSSGKLVPCEPQSCLASWESTYTPFAESSTSATDNGPSATDHNWPEEWSTSSVAANCDSRILYAFTGYGKGEMRGDLNLNLETLDANTGGFVGPQQCPKSEYFENLLLSCTKQLFDAAYPRSICNSFKVDSEGPFKCTKIKPSTNPKTKDEAIAWFKTNQAATSICEIYKADTSGPYLCTPGTPSGAFPTTNDEAVAYYKKNYNADAICAPLKDNAPFQCTGSEQKSIFEIISLSYSNAEMIFGLLGSMIVFFLYKCKRAKDPDALDEDALMDRLDALEADNKELKKLKDNVEALEAWKALERNQIATFSPPPPPAGPTGPEADITDDA